MASRPSRCCLPGSHLPSPQSPPAVHRRFPPSEPCAADGGRWTAAVPLPVSGSALPSLRPLEGGDDRQPAPSLKDLVGGGPQFWGSLQASRPEVTRLPGGNALRSWPRWRKAFPSVCSSKQRGGAGAETCADGAGDGPRGRLGTSPRDSYRGATVTASRERKLRPGLSS